MKDRFMNGFVAGVIADLPVIVLDFLASKLKLDKLDFKDFVSILAFAEPKPDFGESIFASIVQCLFAGVIGVAFNYFIKLVKKEYYYIKAFIFGAMIWFIIYAVDIFFKIEDRVGTDFKTSVVHYGLSILWGIITAWTIQWLEKRERQG
jgi:hypothetical protein